MRTHRPLAAALFTFALTAPMWLLSACTYVLTPPSAQAIADPVQIALVSMGSHTELALPRECGAYAQYSFGEWEWCAMENTGPRAILLLVPHRGTVARQSFQDMPAVLAQPAAVQVLEMTVSHRRAADLLARLDAYFEARLDQAHSPEGSNYTFVPSDESYTLLGNNCNVVLVRWLEEAGVEVSGHGPDGSFRLNAPEPSAIPVPRAQPRVLAGPGAAPTPPVGHAE